MKQSDYAALVAEGNRQFRDEVFPAEMEEIRARRRARAESLGLPLPADEGGGPESNLFGVALSGGGIRAATFSLGVLQSLQKNGLLEHADYLSTVSGGGFIGTCLTSLMRRKGDQFPFLQGNNAEEPRALSYLRDRARYLAPRGTLDVLRIPALLLRGVIGNFILIFPFLAAMGVAVGAGRWFYRSVGGHDFNVWQWTNYLHLTPWLAAGVLAWTMVSYIVATYFVRSLTGRRRFEYTFVWAWTLLPLVAIAELQPYFIRLFHAWRLAETPDGWWTKTAGAMGVLTTVVTVARGVYSVKPLVRPAGLALAALAGLVLPYFVYLCAADVINFGEPIQALIMVIGALFLVIAGFVIADLNVASMHGFFRDRLSEAFLVGRDANGDLQPDDELLLTSVCAEGSVAPYPIYNATLNLQGSSDIRLRGRQADFFVFTKRFVGSARAGYCPTPYMEHVLPAFGVGTAMAISGAATTPNMGSLTLRPIVFLMGLLNIRLGYWLPNPRVYRRWATRSVLAQSLRETPPARPPWLARLLLRVHWAPSLGYFLRELLSRLHEESRHINLSDGGHLENTGLFELLRRRCRFIVASDAGADPGHIFADFSRVMRFARTDLGVRIDINLDDLRLGQATRCHRHFALGTLWYPAHGDLPEMTGYLLYFKPSITGDEDEIVNEYRADSPEFPHESTADQMFEEAQFEAYRALGSHLADGAFAARAVVGRAPGATEAWFRGLTEALASEKKPA
ncbi:MAG: patatin-like phospholipase family protein [Byssovorax sp.]